jgi:CBS domain-containing protein
MQVKVVMRNPVSTIDVDAPLEQARSLMASEKLRHVPVKEGPTVVGFLSERALRRVQPSTLTPLDAWEFASAVDRLRVRDVMSAPLLSVGPDASVREAASLLASNRMEALSVLEGSDLVGLVSVQDLLGVLGRDVEQRRRSRLGHILAAVDDRPGSRTLTTALALARHHDARLTLAWVLAPLPRRQLPEVSLAQWEEVSKQRRRDARAWLASQVADTAEGRTADLIVAEGDLTAEIAALAELREAEVIVVDARSAASVMVEAPCPVLGVPPTPGTWHARG